MLRLAETKDALAWKFATVIWVSAELSGLTNSRPVTAVMLEPETVKGTLAAPWVKKFGPKEETVNAPGPRTVKYALVNVVGPFEPIKTTWCGPSVTVPVRARSAAIELSDAVTPETEIPGSAWPLVSSRIAVILPSDAPVIVT